jgi:hypothetical protein
MLRPWIRRVLRKFGNRINKVGSSNSGSLIDGVYIISVKMCLCLRGSAVEFRKLFRRVYWNRALTNALFVKTLDDFL